MKPLRLPRLGEGDLDVDARVGPCPLAPLFLVRAFTSPLLEHELSRTRGSLSELSKDLARVRRGGMGVRG